MRQQLSILCFIIWVSLSGLAQNSDDRFYYIVQPNDTASDILYRAAIKPLYPRHKKSTLQTLIEENKGLLQDISRIYPGQKIYFSKKTIEKALTQNLVEIKAHNEIVFTESNTAEPMTSAPVVLSEIAVSIAPAEVVEEIQPAEIYFYLGSGYSKINSTYRSSSAKASLLSDKLLHFKAGWTQSLEDIWNSYVQFELLSVPYRDSNQSQVMGRAQNLTTFEFGAIYLPDSAWSYKLAGGMRENIFALSFQAGTVDVDKRPQFYIQGAVSKNIFEKNQLKLKGDVGLSHYFSDSSASYSVSSGLAYILGLEMIRDFSKQDWRARFEYSERHFKTSLTDQDEKLFLATVGMTLPVRGPL